MPLPDLAEYALPVGLCQMLEPSMGLAAAPSCSYISVASEWVVSTTIWGLRPGSTGLMRALLSFFSTSVCLAAWPIVLACGQTDLCQQFLGLLATGQVANIYLQIKPLKPQWFFLSLFLLPFIAKKLTGRNLGPLHTLGQSSHGFSFVTPLRNLCFSLLIYIWEINIYLFF